MSNITNILQSFDLQQLRDVLSAVNDLIIQKSRQEVSSQSIPNQIVSGAPPDVQDFVDYHEHFCRDEGIDLEFLAGELESLGFKGSKSCKKVQNVFISESGEPYIWSSRNGRKVMVPAGFLKFPVIKSICVHICNKFGIDLNCVLVSYYDSGLINTRLHDDGESTMDQSKPICVLTVGTERKIEFFSKHIDTLTRSPDLSLTPANGSLYIMKPGCQQNFRHRVRKNKNIKDSRICLSFRAFVSNSAEASKPPPVEISSTPRPVPSVPQAGTVSSCQINPSPITTPRTSNKVAESTECKKSLNFSSATDGYSPFHPDSSNVNSSNVNSSLGSGVSAKVCVLFGTSITTDISAEKLSRKGRTFVNRSHSGAFIGDIMDEMDDFFHEHSTHVSNIDKIIFSVGTNEIKYLNCYRVDIFHKFYSTLMKLVEHANNLFPRAQIVFQCVLPILTLYTYTAETVHRFNELLLEVCRRTGSIFFDCFRYFLNDEGSNIRERLYRDKFHLSKETGIKVLARALKSVIHGNIFNPLMRNRFLRPYYFI